MNKNMMITVLLLIIVGAGAFYGGMQYEKSKQAPAVGGQYAMQGGQGQYGGGQGRQGGMMGRRFGQNGGAVRGKITSISDTSVTVQMMDGSSKIILLSGSTNISKATTGAKSDLTTGAQIMAIGTPNSDGSVTAQYIQLNPMTGMMRNASPSAGQ